jgi:hypothetical protein
MERHLGAVVMTAALIIISAGATPALEGVDGKPSFRVEEADLDLGTVVAGDVATATFVFHNDGPDDVHIIRAKPS